MQDQVENCRDPYASETYRWWHLSEASPELLAAARTGWLPPGGVAVDVGCGLGTEIGWLAAQGYRAVGVDSSLPALQRAANLHPNATFVRADVRALPMASGSVGLLIDRGCFHYLDPADRSTYVEEVGRVAPPGGRFLLRACLTSAGRRNGVSAQLLRTLFSGAWNITSMDRAELPSDTRTMPAVVVQLTRRS